MKRNKPRPRHERIRLWPCEVSVATGRYPWGRRAAHRRWWCPCKDCRRCL